MFTQRRGIKWHASAKRMPFALAAAVSAVMVRNGLPFVTGISILSRAKRGPWLQAGGFSEPMQQASNDSFTILSEAAPAVILVLLAGILLRTLSGGAATTVGPQNESKKSGGAARVSVISNVGVTFDDIPDYVPGNSEAKAELAILVDFLRSPEVFLKLGAKLPKRVLLSGPGDKAEMAKAVAGEAGVPFLEIVSSDLPDHDIFEEAQQKAPCVLFIPLDRRPLEEGEELPAGKDLEKTSEPLEKTRERLFQVLQEMECFQSSGLTFVFVAASGEQDEVKKERLSRFFELGVTVGYEPEILVGRRLLRANRFEEAIESFRLAFYTCDATDDIKAEIENAQDLLEQHWQKYHDLCLALPCNGISERSLRVRQNVSCDYCSLCGDQGPGGAVWVAGLALANFVAQNDPPGDLSNGSEKIAPWSGMKVLELGSGTGIVGLAAASAGADVLLTDRSRFVPLMARNIRLNQDNIDVGSADCAAFEWTDVEQPPEKVQKQTWDIVLGADLVYNSADVSLFADTLAFLIGPLGAAAGAPALYAHCSRSEALDMQLLCALKERGLIWKDLPAPPVEFASSVPGARAEGGARDEAPDEVVFWEFQYSSEEAMAASPVKVLPGQKCDMKGMVQKMVQKEKYFQVKAGSKSKENDSKA